MSQIVLVVEDNPITRKFARITLSAEGLEIAEAESGEAALAMVQTRPPDLILQDLTLHDMDGFVLASRLRELAPHTPIVAFTGLNDEPRIRSAGFADVMLKPIEPDRLSHMVWTHLRREPPGSIALPRTRTQDRAWNVVRTTLSRLTELVGSSRSVDQTLTSVLESMLDASGFSMGFVCTVDSGGGWRVCAQLGLGDAVAAELAARWKAAHDGALALDEPVELVRPRDGDLLDPVAIRSALLVPLPHAGHRVGVLALASGNELHPDWRQLAHLLAAPLAQAVTLARTATRLVASETKFRGIADSTADGILLSDASGLISYANASAAAILGRSAGELIGTRVSQSIPVVASERWSGNVRRGDEQVPVAISLRTFEDPPAQLNRVYVVRDLSQHVRVETFSRLANQDALTGICNRRRFEEELRSRVASARRYGTDLALLLIDLDRFKPINDTYGHPAGDAVLIGVAQLLATRTRESDMVARLGGDEFAILLDHTALDGARICADNLRAHIADLVVPFDGTSLTVGASIGIATCPADATSPEELIAAADRALYRAKHGGMRTGADRGARVPRGTPAAGSVPRVQPAGEASPPGDGSPPGDPAQRDDRDDCPCTD